MTEYKPVYEYYTPARDLHEELKKMQNTIDEIERKVYNLAKDIRNYKDDGK
jgi:peptidoglycan hydrolase CwlO-like protein